ncbi:MAG: hypothetical protein V2J20_01930 [Wenzhouxiangella sp.]|jgi:hypothetical protein|nr:hypothetical protein [Wenzhouxiangella sp.]
MQTFSELEAYIREHYKVVHDEPFMLAVDVKVGNSGRSQDIWLAELKNSDERRVLRFETNIAPLREHDAEKCLRVNLMLRIGYLAVGDMDGTPFIKLCHNLTYDLLSEASLRYVINHMALLGDSIEDTLTGGEDLF